MWASAYLTIVNVSADEWCAAIAPRERLIGRGVDASIRIPPRFSYASRRHAEIWADQGGPWIRDVGSSAGTNINGVWLKPHKAHQLAVADRIWLGGVELEWASSLGPLSQIIAEMGLNPPVDGDDDTIRLERRTTVVPPAFLLQQLTHAELEVVLWMCRGYTQVHELGRKLHRSPNTIRTHLGKVFTKLGVHSREELLGWLQRANVPPGHVLQEITS